MNLKKLIIIILSISFIMINAYAEEKAEKEELSPQKVDIKDLEKKYWTPKDTKYNVVQNRTYGKENRFALSLQAGFLINDTFNDGLNINAALNYYFNENHGLELNYIHTDHDDAKAVEVFLKDLGSSVAPDFNRINNYVGVNYNFIPFYAKVSVLGWKIIYFDFAFSPGVGMVNYTQQQDHGLGKDISTVALNFDITQHFYFNKHFAIRVDFRNLWFTEEIVAHGKTTLDDRGDRSNNTTMLNIGLQYLF